MPVTWKSPSTLPTTVLAWSSLTSEGDQEVRRLREIGIERFAKFVADWEPSEVRTFTALLQKLERPRQQCSA